LFREDRWCFCVLPLLEREREREKEREREREREREELMEGYRERGTQRVNETSLTLPNGDNGATQVATKSSS
jgi:hypothetical protein